MNRWMKTGIVYGVSFCLASVVWIGLFYTPLFASLGVFFYRGIILLVLTSFCLTIGLYWFSRQSYFGSIGMKDILLCVTLFFSFHMLFFTHIPVTAERSISIFLLGYVNAHQETVTKEAIQEDFIHTYVTTYDAMEKRLQEQLATGTIKQDDNGYRITNKGQLLMRVYEVIAGIFRIDTRLIRHQ